jgi:hypothetical protein
VSMTQQSRVKIGSCLKRRARRGNLSLVRSRGPDVILVT